MGWTYYHAATDWKGRVNRKAECDKISTWERHCPLMRFSANNRIFKKCLNACA